MRPEPKKKFKSLQEAKEKLVGRAAQTMIMAIEKGWNINDKRMFELVKRIYARKGKHRTPSHIRSQFEWCKKVLSDLPKV